MVMEKLSDRVRDLIGENEQRAAVDLLLQALRDQNADLYNIALIQQANIKKLADQSAIGILSTEERNREQAKINVALLHLSDEHARLYEGTPIGIAWPRRVGWAAAILLSLAVIGWLVKLAVSAPAYPTTFDLEVRAHEPAGEQLALREGEVNVRLGGQLYPLDAEGNASLRDLNANKGDSVHLQYFPRPGRRFKASQPSAVGLSGQNQAIDFTLDFLDTTFFVATLRDLKGPLAGAQITVDGNLHTTSDEHGYFKIAIPKASGSTAHFLVEKNGQRRYEQTITISPSLKSIRIE